MVCFDCGKKHGDGTSRAYQGVKCVSSVAEIDAWKGTGPKSLSAKMLKVHAGAGAAVDATAPADAAEASEVADLRSAAKLLNALAVRSEGAVAATAAAPPAPTSTDNARGVEETDLVPASTDSRADARRKSKPEASEALRDSEPVVAPKQGSDCTPRDAIAETTPEEVEAPTEAAPAHEADASADPRRWHRLRGLAASRSSSKPPERTERPTVERKAQLKAYARMHYIDKKSPRTRRAGVRMAPVAGAVTAGDVLMSHRTLFVVLSSANDVTQSDPSSAVWGRGEEGVLGCANNTASVRAGSLEGTGQPVSAAQTATVARDLATAFARLHAEGSKSCTSARSSSSCLEGRTKRS